MSQITDQIQAYKNGSLSWDDLFTFLVDYKYAKPERFKQPQDPTKEEDVPYENDEGTWDEVDTARWSGLLTQDEYQQLLKAIWQKHAPDRVTS